MQGPLSTKYPNCLKVTISTSTAKSDFSDATFSELFSMRGSYGH